jgi:hypothetical protein
VQKLAGNPGVEGFSRNVCDHPAASFEESRRRIARMTA